MRICTVVRRVRFIAPVIIIACSRIRGDVQILAKEVIGGDRVCTSGSFQCGL